MKLRRSSMNTLLLFPILLTGCLNIAKPTRFIGKVIDSSSDQPIVDGYLLFIGERNTGIYKYPVSIDTVYLDSEGKFDWTVANDNEGVNSISILVTATKPGTSEPLNLDNTNCSPYNSCYNFTPGKKHTFDIKVTWPPDE